MADVSTIEVVQGGGVAAFAALVAWLLRWRIVREDQREERIATERSKREERQVIAAESQAAATAAQAAAMGQLAGAMRDVVVEVKDLGRQVQGMREDLDELTPVLSPGGAERQRTRAPAAAEASPGYRGPARAGGREG